MVANSQGTYRTNYHKTMAAYDKLPRVVRNALADAAQDWVPQPVLTRFRRELKSGQWPSDAAERCVRMIRRWDKEERAEHYYRLDRMAERGVDYNHPIRRRKKFKEEYEQCYIQNS